MRHLGLCAVLLGACIPDEQDWVVTEARFRGVQVDVVEPGGYSSQLNHPPGRTRATALPLDTVEVSWHVAVPPGDEPQPPIWVACHDVCVEQLGDFFQSIQSVFPAALPECPHPLPLVPAETCRLGEGHRVRVSLGGAFTLDEHRGALALLVVGSRRADLSPATCLERLSTRPLPPVESCVFGLASLYFGPWWAALPFDPDHSAMPPEFRDQEVDTNPEIAAIRVTRERGGERVELLAAPGDDVPVRRGERVRVEPLFAAGSAQEFVVMVGGDEGVPWSGTPDLRQEQLEWHGWFSAPVEAFEPATYDGWQTTALEWVVPHDVVPTTLYLDVRDDRSGFAFAELRFVEADSTQ